MKIKVRNRDRGTILAEAADVADTSAKRRTGLLKHSKLDPGSEESKLKDGLGTLVRPLGPPVIVVVGGAVSTVKLREAGVGSVLPSGSMARTSKLWSPSASEL